jgi:hypothetical protein
MAGGSAKRRATLHQLTISFYACLTWPSTKTGLAGDQATQLTPDLGKSNLHDFSFFRRQRQIHLANEMIGDLLHFALVPLFVIFAN